MRHYLKGKWHYQKPLICLVALLFFFTTAYSQGEGEMTKRNISHYGCNISSITVQWEFKSLMGEPVRNGTFKWEASRGEDKDCLTYNDFVILKVSNGNTFSFVKIDPTVPESGEGYAYNVSGSPSWSDLFCGYDGNGRKMNCWSEDGAKRFWKTGFEVVDFKLKRYQR